MSVAFLRVRRINIEIKQKNNYLSFKKVAILQKKLSLPMSSLKLNLANFTIYKISFLFIFPPQKFVEKYNDQKKFFLHHILIFNMEEHVKNKKTIFFKGIHQLVPCSHMRILVKNGLIIYWVEEYGRSVFMFSFILQ